MGSQRHSGDYLKLSEALNAFSTDTGNLSDVERNDLVIKLRETLYRVESPWQQIQNLIWENSGHATALKVAHDIGLFKNWPQGDGDSGKGHGVAELCGLVKPACEPDLLDLERVLSALAFRGTLASPSSKHFIATPFSRALAEPTMAACLEYWFQIQTPALTALPQFFAENAYKVPTDPHSKTAWNIATRDPDTPFFAWLQQRPEVMGAFAQVMQRYSSSQPAWVELYPSERLLKPEEHEHQEDQVVLVDVGGSLGHDTMKFVNKHKSQLQPKSCVLQDSKDVLNQAQVDMEAVVLQPYDFFKEDQQPVKGARAYYLHNVLHDWPDDQCRDILSKLKTAMASHKSSRILIHELIRSEDGARDLVSVGEFTVLAILGSPERTEVQWRTLIESVGLRLVEVHKHQLSTHSILEVMQ